MKTTQAKQLGRKALIEVLPEEIGFLPFHKKSISGKLTKEDLRNSGKIY